MRRVIAVCGILMVLFTLGAFAQGYAKGYEDGKRDVREDVRNSDIISLGSGAFLRVPSERMTQIQNMPESYQEGYVMGYKDTAAESIISSPKWWFGLMLTVGFLGVVLLLLFAMV